MRQNLSVWSHMAKSWHAQETPLKPQQTDLKNYQQVINSFSEEFVRQAIILGVTPELHQLLSGNNFSVRAVDSNIEMISKIWPGLHLDAYLSNWVDIDRLPLKNNIFICDGGLHLMSRVDQDRLIVTLGNMIGDQGYVCFRFFAPPPNQADIKSSNKIMKQFEENQIPSISYLKVCLWFASDLNHDGVVKLSDIWKVIFNQSHGEIDKYLMSLGHAQSDINTLYPYESSTVSYQFSSINQIKDMFQKRAGLTLRDELYPDYWLANQFPILSFSK